MDAVLRAQITMETFSLKELEALSGIWAEIISPGHPFWCLFCFFALILLGINTYFKILDIADRSESLSMTWFLTLKFLGSSLIISSLLFPWNPALPSAIKLGVGFQYLTIDGMLHVPIAGTNMSEAIAARNATITLNQYSSQILGNCVNTTKEKSLEECLKDPNKIEKLLNFYNSLREKYKYGIFTGVLLDTFLKESKENNLDETISETVINSPENTKLTNSIFWGIHNKTSTTLVTTIIFYTALAPLFISFIVNPHLSIVFHQWLLILVQLFITELSDIFIVGITAIKDQVLSNNGVPVGSISNSFNTSLELGLVVPITLALLNTVTNVSLQQPFNNFMNQYSQTLGKSLDRFAYDKILKHFRPRRR